MKPIQNLIKILFITFNAQCLSSAEFSLPGLGEAGDDAAVFAPGVISKKGRLEQNITFSPDGKEIYFTIINQDWSKCEIVGVKYNETEDQWEELDTSGLFDAQYYETEPRFSPDGKILYFISTRPQQKLNEDWTGGSLWMSRRTDAGWGSPEQVKGFEDIWHPFVDTHPNLYFLSYQHGGFGGGDLFYVPLEGPSDGEFVNMGDQINSPQDDADPFVSSDGKLLLFDSNRPGSKGQFDLYLSRKSQNGEWANPTNLGEKVNTKFPEYSAVISPDGKFLFFSRRYVGDNKQHENDIFWIKADILDQMQP